MNEKSQTSAKVFILLVVIFYVFSEFAPLMHHHYAGVDQNNCIICYYSLNYQCLETTSQLGVQKPISHRILDFFEPAEYSLKTVFLHDLCRAPPQLQMA